MVTMPGQLLTLTLLSLVPLVLSTDSDSGGLTFVIEFMEVETLQDLFATGK